jgi:hypothetical protein
MQADPASFVKIGPKFRTFIFTHVDDILLFTPRGNSEDIHKILQRFEGKLFGEVKFFLGMNIARDRAARTISVDQSGLIRGLVRRSGCDAVGGSSCPLPPGRVLFSGTHHSPLSDEQSAMYPAVVGSLLYIATVTRPDIAYAAAALARYLSKPTKELLDSAMHVVKYMKYTEQCKLFFGARRNAKPVGLYGLPSAPSFPALAYGDADCDDMCC